MASNWHRNTQPSSFNFITGQTHCNLSSSSRVSQKLQLSSGTLADKSPDNNQLEFAASVSVVLFPRTWARIIVEDRQIDRYRCNFSAFDLQFAPATHLVCWAASDRKLALLLWGQFAAGKERARAAASASDQFKPSGVPILKLLARIIAHFGCKHTSPINNFASQNNNDQRG